MIQDNVLNRVQFLLFLGKIVELYDVSVQFLVAVEFLFYKLILLEVLKGVDLDEFYEEFYQEGFG